MKIDRKWLTGELAQQVAGGKTCVHDSFSAWGKPEVGHGDDFLDFYPGQRERERYR